LGLVAAGAVAILLPIAVFLIGFIAYAVWRVVTECRKS
jgi:hypothetical protein